MLTSSAITGFTKANQAANYYFWLDELSATIRETDENRDRGPRDGCRSYDFDDVQFSYPLAPDNRVLKGVSLSVRPHKTADDWVLLPFPTIPDIIVRLN